MAASPWLSLGPRRSERGYSTDDLRLLNSLAGYAAPAYGLSEHYREIFELTRLGEAIAIYDNEESALNGAAK
jgi:hypothetical protein